jgi:hypothetical protein
VKTKLVPVVEFDKKLFLLGSNTYGIAGLYPLKAIDEGLLGMSFTNSYPMVAPTRALEVSTLENFCFVC